MNEEFDKKRKKPKQARSRAMYDDILDATSRVLMEDGFHRTSTTRIAERAGISAGSLYQYFGNRQDIFDALAARQSDRLADILNGHFNASGSDELPTSIDRMIDAVIESSSGFPPLKVIFAGETEQIRPGDPRYTRARRLTEHILQVLDRHAAELRADIDMDDAAFIIGSLVEAAADAAVRNGASAATSPAVTAEFKALLRTYLTRSRR